MSIDTSLLAQENKERLDALKKILDLPEQLGDIPIASYLPIAYKGNERRIRVTDLIEGDFSIPYNVTYIPVDIYYTSSGSNQTIQERLVEAINTSQPFEVDGITRYRVTYSVGTTVYTALFEHSQGTGIFGEDATQVTVDALQPFAPPREVDLVDDNDLAVATSISDSINNGGQTYDTSIFKIFRRIIDGEQRVFAYTPEGEYEETIGLDGATVTENDFEDITSNGDGDSSVPVYSSGRTEVNIIDYGGVGDGVTDNLQSFLDARDEASALGVSVYIPKGDFLVNHNSTSVIYMGNCSGITGVGNLIFEVPSADTPVLYWEGERELISGNLTFLKGDKTATINQGFDIKTGDTVFLVCPNEAFSTNITTNYVKGQRLTVDSVVVGASDDTITFQEAFDDNVDGFLVWNSSRPKVKLEGVNVSCFPPIDRKGIELTICDVEINQFNVIDFQRFNVNISSSKAIIKGLKTSSDKYGGTFTSYGLQVSGLSDVLSYGCNLNGGRHGLTHGDVGYWNASYFGLTSSNLFLPSTHTIYSSNVSSNDVNTGLDTHRGTKFFRAVSVNIENGFVVGGLYSEIENCVIKSGLREIPITFGRDATDFSIPFGYVKMKNNKVIAGTYPLKYQNSLQSLEIDGLEITTEGGITDLIQTNETSGNKAAPVDQSYKNIRFKDLGTTQYTFNLFKRNKLEIDGYYAEKVGISMTDGGNLTTEKVVLNNINTDGAIRGILATNLDNINFKLSNTSFKNSTAENAFFLNCEGIVIDLLDSCFNESNAGGIRVRSDAYTINFSNVKVQGNAGRGIQLQDSNALGNNSYSFSGVIATGNSPTLGDYDIAPTVVEIPVRDSDGLVEDTTWQTATLPSGVSGSFKYKIKNGRLLLRFIGFQKSTSGITEVFTLPLKYRPDEEYFNAVPAELAKSEPSCFFQVRLDGRIFVTTASGTSNSKYYLTADHPLKTND